MARSLSSELQAAYNDPSRVQVVLITFQFGTGTYGLWTGLGEKEYNGIIYRPGGSILDLSDIQEGIGGQVQSCELSLSTAKSKLLTADILQTFYDEDWHMQTVIFQAGLLDPTTRDIIGLQTLFRGTLDEAPWKQDKKEAKIVAKIVSKSLLLSDNGGLYRNDETQKLFNPDDDSLEGIGNLGGAVTIDSRWGQTT
jgi:hypothetical protein